ncbi:MAG: hypothetical protein Q7R41_12190, partial [Phycisphaerales bacterium]|nr:hypothetical protein [Phycisphaerales bacterium]
VLTNRQQSICDVPRMVFGNMPNDDGNLLIDDLATVESIKCACPESVPFIREIICAREYLNGQQRWCLWLRDAPPALIRRCEPIHLRVQAVRRYRRASRRETTVELADSPALFGEIRQPTTRYVLIPRHSSENRNYIPMSYFDPEIIAHDSCLALPNSTPFHFGVLSSAMHMAWVRQVCGRLKSDYRYSAKLVYNNFPWPQEVTDIKRERVDEATQAVLDARAQFTDASLADLYDPIAMPVALRRAHERLDRAVDACYRRQPFTSERQRLEFLFNLYEQLVAPLTGPSTRQRRRRR